MKSRGSKIPKIIIAFVLADSYRELCHAPSLPQIKEEEGKYRI